MGKKEILNNPINLASKERDKFWKKEIERFQYFIILMCPNCLRRFNEDDERKKGYLCKDCVKEVTPKRVNCIVKEEILKKMEATKHSNKNKLEAKR